MNAAPRSSTAAHGQGRGSTDNRLRHTLLIRNFTHTNTYSYLIKERSDKFGKVDREKL